MHKKQAFTTFFRQQKSRLKYSIRFLLLINLCAYALTNCFALSN